MAGKGKEHELAIKIAGKVESSFNSAMGKAASGLKSVAKVAAAASAAAVIALGALTMEAVNVGREYEESMSQVAATMLLDKSTEEGAAALQTLENAARECGRTTAFSATEASEALNYLALAGYDAEQAAVALPTVLNLAGAGAMDLATASDMVTDSMSALQIEATEANLENFADQLAMTASKANTSVEQLGEAIITVGGTAANLAGGTTELNASLGILADAGIKGSEGGTKLRNMILSLQTPTDNARACLDSLGVSVYDAEGNMRGMNEIFSDLNSSMENFTQAEIDEALSTIFNKTDLAAANALLADSGDRFDELAAAIENSAGACEEMYGIQLDNLNGDLAIMKSGLEDLGISVYQGLNAPLREMTQIATGMVGQLSDAFFEGGLEGLVGEIGNVLSQVVGIISSYAPQVMNMAISLVKSFVTGIGSNKGEIANAAAEVLTIFANGLLELVPELIFLGIDLIVALAEGLDAQLPSLIANGSNAIASFVSGISSRLPDVISVGLSLLQTLVSSLLQNAPMLLVAAVQLLASLLSGFNDMLPAIASMGIQILLSLTDTIMNVGIPLLLNVAVPLIVNFVNGIVDMLPFVLQAAVQLVLALVVGIAENAEGLFQAAGQLVGALAKGLLTAIPLLLVAAVELIDTLLNMILETNWIEVGINLITAIGQGILDGAAGLGDSIISGVKNFFGFGEHSEEQAEGYEAITSYASGMEQGTGEVQSAVASIQSETVSNLTVDGFDSGYGTALTFTDGLTDGTALALNASTNLGTESIGAINTALDNSQIDTSAFQVGESATGNLSSGLVSNMPEVAETAGQMGDSTIEALTESIESGAEGVQESFSNLGESVSESMDQSWTMVIENAENAMTNLNDIIAQSTEMLGMEIETSMTQLATDYSSKWEETLTSTTSIWTELLTLGTQSFTELSNVTVKTSTETTTQLLTIWISAKTGLAAVWRSFSSTFSSAWSSVHNTAVSRSRATASAIKSAFENMTITIPRPKLPKVSVSYSTVSGGEGATAKVPKFSVSYFAAGGVMTRPTMFGLDGSRALVGGEAGPEAILPLATLWDQMKKIMLEIMRNGDSQIDISGLADVFGKIKNHMGSYDDQQGHDSIVPDLGNRISGTSKNIVSELLDRLSGKEEQESTRLVTPEGIQVNYNPTYNFTGTPDRNELIKAEHVSQLEFDQLMKKWIKDNKRKKF